MEKTKRQPKSIDKVTVDNLDIALRMCKIYLDRDIIDKIIDLVELIEDKGDDATIGDVYSLQIEWDNLIYYKQGGRF